MNYEYTVPLNYWEEDLGYGVKRLHYYETTVGESAKSYKKDGWRCPCCGTVYPPETYTCSYCSPPHGGHYCY